MSQDTEDLATRLAALEGATGKRRARGRASVLTALLGVGGIATLGGVMWIALQPMPEAMLVTAAPDEFQTLGSGFGDLAPMRQPDPPPAPDPVETGPSSADLALMESLATLRAELEELRARPTEVPDDRGMRESW